MADNVTLSPTDDSYIQAGSADANNGTATTLQCGIWQEMWSDATPGLKAYNNQNVYGNLTILQFNVKDYVGKITGATLKITGNNPSTNSNARSLYLGYCDVTGWSESTVTNANSNIVTRNKNGLNIHPFGYSESIPRDASKEISYSADALVTFLNENADDDGNVTFIVYGLGQECNINSKEAETGKPSLQITYTNETLYTATFTELNGKTPTVTVYSDEARTTSVLASALSANTTYYYTAQLSGYKDYNGSFEVATSNPTVNFTMEEEDHFTFTVDIVDASNNVVKNVYTDNDAYAGKDYSCVVPMFITDGNNKITYQNNSEVYYYSGKVSSENKVIKIPFTAYSGNGYFVEAETAITATNVNSANCSSNTAVRGFNTNKTVLTVPEDGIYTVNYAFASYNVNAERTLYAYKNSDDNVIASDARQFSVNYIKTTGKKSVEGVELKSGDKIIVKGSDTNIILDYVYIVRTGDLPPAVTELPITNTEYFESDYDNSKEITGLDAEGNIVQVAFIDGSLSLARSSYRAADDSWGYSATSGTGTLTEESGVVTVDANVVFHGITYHITGTYEAPTQVSEIAITTKTGCIPELGQNFWERKTTAEECKTMIDYDNSAFYIDAMHWRLKADQTMKEASAVCEANTNYELYMHYVLRDGYEFADEVTVTVDGETARISKDFKEIYFDYSIAVTELPIDVISFVNSSDIVIFEGKDNDGNDVVVGFMGGALSTDFSGYNASDNEWVYAATAGTGSLESTAEAASFDAVVTFENGKTYHITGTYTFPVYTLTEPTVTADMTSIKIVWTDEVISDNYGFSLTEGHVILTVGEDVYEGSVNETDAVGGKLTVTIPFNKVYHRTTFEPSYTPVNGDNISIKIEGAEIDAKATEESDWKKIWSGDIDGLKAIVDNTTGINSVSSAAAKNATIYNLAGQRVNAKAKGLVIKSGKKVFVK